MRQWLLLLLLLLISVPAIQAQVAVVAHQSVPIETIEPRRLLDIYSLEETKWNDGTRIVLFDIKGTNDIKQSFYAFLGRRPSEMKRIWLRIILSGEGRSPTKLKSVEAMLANVAETPGSIGYIPLALATQEVKILATIDK